MMFLILPKITDVSHSLWGIPFLDSVAKPNLQLKYSLWRPTKYHVHVHHIRIHYIVADLALKIILSGRHSCKHTHTRI